MTLAASTSRTNLGVAIGSDVQAFISATAGTNANGNRTVSTNNPTGGSDGDIWLQGILHKSAMPMYVKDGGLLEK